MKYLIRITLGLLIYMVAVASCKDDDDSGIAGFAIDKEDITIGADGGTDVVNVSSGGEWAASSTEPWVNISPANGSGVTECTVVIDSTLINGIRTAEVRFTPVSYTHLDVYKRQVYDVARSGYAGRKR